MITSISEPKVATESKILSNTGPCIRCVFLTSSEREFRAAVAVLSATPVSLHHAATLEQADFQLDRTGARVLLTELKFPDGSWEDTLEMLSYSYPQVALVLAAAHADERLWIRALERGAFDLVAKPFQGEELRRILENADAHSTTSTSGHAPGSQTASPSSPPLAGSGGTRSAGST